MKTLTLVKTIAFVAITAIFPTQAVELVKAEQIIDNKALKVKAQKMLLTDNDLQHVFTNVKTDVKASLKASTLAAQENLTEIANANNDSLAKVNRRLAD